MITNHPVGHINTRFQMVPRSRHLIARVLDLDDKEYRLWDLFSALTPYDYSKKEVVPYVETTDLQLSQIMGDKKWTRSVICKTRQELEAKNVIQKLKNSSYRILVLMDRDIPAFLHDEVVKLKEEIANMQYEPEVKTKVSNTSNKSSNLSIPDKDITLPSRIRNQFEYEEIQREGNYQQITIEDMMWIDSQKYN